jgi:hypothetical protein
MKQQLPMLLNLFKQEQFLLIVMDSCRFDFFERNYQDFLQGELEPVWSPASATLDWLFACIARPMKDVLMLSHHVGINAKTPWNGYAAYKHFGRVRYVGYETGPGIIARSHPNLLLRAYSQECDWDKTIAWMLQPHIPYHNPVFQLTQKQIMHDIRAGNPQRIRKGYQHEVRWGIEYVRKIVDQSSVSKVVVTADHGECFGTNGLWLHPRHSNHKLLHTVPWLEVTK